MPRIPSRIQRAFIGPDGIRTPWLLGIFAIVVVLGTLLADRAKIALIHALPRGPESPLEPVRLTVRKLGDFVPLVIAGFVMARLEKRRVGDYGLALRRGFRTTFWEGALYGFGGVTLVLGAACLAGHASFGSIALHGADAIRWSVVFLLAFLAVALFEEYAYRGYALYRVAIGIGFWPAAVVMAAVFGFAHGGNPGETPLGLANLVAFFLVFCFVLRRTGDLWLAVGFHMAWNWTEAFVYGLPDSGIVAPAHLFASQVRGPDLWTGGTAGPEGTILDLVVLAIVALLVHVRYPTVCYRPGAPSEAT